MQSTFTYFPQFFTLTSPLYSVPTGTFSIPEKIQLFSNLGSLCALFLSYSVSNNFPLSYFLFFFIFLSLVNKILPITNGLNSPFELQNRTPTALVFILYHKTFITKLFFFITKLLYQIINQARSHLF